MIHLSQKRIEYKVVVADTLLNNLHVGDEDTTPERADTDFKIPSSLNPDESSLSSISTTTTMNSSSDSITSAQYDKRASISLFMSAKLSKHHYDPFETKHLFEHVDETKLNQEEKAQQQEKNTGCEHVVHESVPSIISTTRRISTTNGIKITQLEQTTLDVVDNTSNDNDQSLKDESNRADTWIERILYYMWSMILWIGSLAFTIIRASHHMSVMDEICSSYDYMRVNSPTIESDHHLSIDNNDLGDGSNTTMDEKHEKKTEAFENRTIPYLRNFAYLLKSFSFSSLIERQNNTETLIGTSGNSKNQERRRSKSDPTQHGSIVSIENSLLLSTTSTAPKLTSRKSFSTMEETKELRRRLELYSFP